MAARAEIRDLILGAAEGATAGIALLREADLPVRLEDFDVEVSLRVPGDSANSGPAATIRFSIVAGDSDAGAGSPLRRVEVSL